MGRDRFVAARRERWDRLETLLRSAGRRRLSRLNAGELFELGQLYRGATSDLAIARRDFPYERVTVYLNGLVARAHPIIYRERATSLRRVAWFARFGFPAAYRASGAYTALAFGLMLASALVAAVLVTYRSSLADILLGTDQTRYMRGVMVHHHLWVKSATENHSVASSFIMLNNIHVAFVAFAGGMLVGTLTIYVMIQNGINLGATAALVAQYGLSAQLWSFVLPHGVIELSVIFAAGGAGLMIADAILRPGLLSRGEALVRAGRRAAYLILGCVPLLVVAGTIEGNFSPSDAPIPAKLTVGLVAGVLLYTYLLRSRPKMVSVSYEFRDVIEPRESGHSTGRVPVVE